MAEKVPVRCPACLRTNDYVLPVFPCACGSPVSPPLDLVTQAVPLTHRTWSESWVAVRCGSCGRESEWPHPEVGCGSCGTVVLVPVHPVGPVEPVEPVDCAAPADSLDAVDPARPGAPAPPEAGGAGAPGRAGHAGAVGRAGTDGPEPVVERPDALADAPPAAHAGPASPAGTAGPAGPPAARLSRPAFQPVTIRTARDAVASAALYLRWLGFRDVRQPDARPVPSAAVDLRAPGLVAQVDPTTAPAGLRAVECVWLNGLTASATSVYFALAGYTEEARTRADELGIPLFVMDLTGVPQPVNDPADALITAGA
ncbi:hypothetical protein [Streptomyces sp. NPDC090022]|uniref:hypothetical protein n=1 Tax=Streptomyces sp. NPDC090022 TaxID=3365920 RepID=UPI00381955C6